MPTAEQTMMKVQRILTGPMKLNVQLHGDTLAVRFQDASTQVHLRVVEGKPNEDGEPSTLIHVTAPILRAVDPSPALYEWVAREGSDAMFGHVMVLDDSKEPGKLFLLMRHTLLGDYLDPDELQATLWAVLGSADRWDDMLQQRFGGKRSIDE